LAGHVKSGKNGRLSGSLKGGCASDFIQPIFKGAKAAMPKASNLKKGDVVRLKNQIYTTHHIEVQTPSARGSATLYKVRFLDVRSGQKLDQVFKGNDDLEDVELERRPASYLYRDGDMYVFMDSGTYEQHMLSAEALGEDAGWLADGMEGVTVLLLDGRPLCIHLPQTVDLEIVDTPPVIKGATAASRNKPATLSNGAVVQVPEYIESGVMIRVNTETGKFMSRV
jgi:elongation factor P